MPPRKQQQQPALSPEGLGVSGVGRPRPKTAASRYDHGHVGGRQSGILPPVSSSQKQHYQQQQQQPSAETLRAEPSNMRPATSLSRRGKRPQSVAAISRSGGYALNASGGLSSALTVSSLNSSIAESLPASEDITMDAANTPDLSPLLETKPTLPEASASFLEPEATSLMSLTGNMRQSAPSLPAAPASNVDGNVQTEVVVVEEEKEDISGGGGGSDSGTPTVSTTVTNYNVGESLESLKMVRQLLAEKREALQRARVDDEQRAKTDLERQRREVAQRRQAKAESARATRLSRVENMRQSRHAATANTTVTTNTTTTTTAAAAAAATSGANGTAKVGDEFASKLSSLKAAADRRRLRMAAKTGTTEPKSGATTEAAAAAAATATAASAAAASAAVGEAEASPMSPGAVGASVDESVANSAHEINASTSSTARMDRLLSFLDQVDREQGKVMTEFDALRLARTGGGKKRATAATAAQHMDNTFGAVAGTAGATAAASAAASAAEKESMPASDDATLATSVDHKPLTYHEDTVASFTATMIEQRKAVEDRNAELTATKGQLRTAEAEVARLQKEVKTLTVRAKTGKGRAEKAALAEQQAEYETVIKRHLTFIDQLIKDKGELGAQCEQLVAQLQTSENKTRNKIDAMEGRHKAELTKQKQIYAAAEKLRREKFMKEQTAKIQEVTVKGLTPKIQQMLEDHKKEIEELKAEHQQELLSAGGEMSEQYQLQLKAARLQIESGVEERAARERETDRKRTQAQLEEMEKDAQALRRRMVHELEEERAHHAVKLTEEREKMEAELKAIRTAEARTHSAVREDSERAIAEASRRHAREMEDLKRQLAIEKESWEEMFMRKQQAKLSATEEQLREELRKERDREIEAVLTRLEEDTAANQRELEEQMEKRVRRAREKFNTQLSDAEESERAMLAKYNDCKQRLTTALEELADFKGQQAQRESAMTEMRSITDRLTREKDRMRDVVRTEFAEKLASLEHDVETARAQLSEARAEHRSELSHLQRGKDEELDAIHTRVQEAIAKKDKTIALLREQFQASAVRADHLEQLLEKQRKQLAK